MHTAMILAAGAVAALTNAQPAPTHTDADARPGKVLLMHYMPWYVAPATRGRWGEHWTGWQRQHDPDTPAADGLPDIWSHYDPLIGPYDSTDPYVLECQLLQMHIAGIDGVIVDWYGTADAAYYPINQAGSVALFDATKQLGMSFAVCYEDRTIQYLIDTGKIDRGDTAAQLTRDLAWLDTNWFNSPNYVRTAGRPLLLNFGPIFATDPDDWTAALKGLTQPPRLFALHHLWRNINADGGFSWVHPDVWKADPDADTIAQRLHGVFTYTSQDPSQVIPSAWPGFRDVYEHSHPVIDHRDGDTMRETISAALASESPLVQLVTWNDYGEGTMIEPTHQFGYTFLEIIQAADDANAERHTAFDHADLRLPAKLLEHRRRADANHAELDAIRDHILSGNAEAAHEALNAFE